MKQRMPVQGDWVAGLTTAVMLIPQSMAYAMLAGLPAQHGLYAAVVAPLAYALVGRSPHLGVGPVAMDSLLVFAALSVLAEPESPAFVAAAAATALLVGVVQVGFSLSGLHRLASLFSEEMTKGFIGGGALVIACSQLAAALGISRPKDATVLGALGHVSEHVADISWLTAIFAVVTVAGLWVMRRYFSSWPRALIVTAVGGITLFFMPTLSVARVGEVPRGLPLPEVPDFTYLVTLFPAAVAIALVSFAESYSVGQQLADKDDSENSISAQREFFAVGFANLATAFFRGYPVAGGLSRSAVNFDAGAKTRWAGAITAVVVAASLVLATDALYWIPKASLAGIILFAVIKLVDVQAFFRAYREARWVDFSIMLATALVTAGIGVIPGLGVGLGLVALRRVVERFRRHPGG